MPVGEPFWWTYPSWNRPAKTVAKETKNTRTVTTTAVLHQKKVVRLSCGHVAWDTPVYKDGSIRCLGCTYPDELGDLK